MNIRTFFHFPHHQQRQIRQQSHFVDIPIPDPETAGEPPELPPKPGKLSKHPLSLTCSLDSIDVRPSNTNPLLSAPLSDSDNTITLYRLFAAVVPPQRTPKKVPLDFILCLDVSGSMDMPGKMNVIKSAINVYFRLPLIPPFS
jgi:hypothetical protein